MGTGVIVSRRSMEEGGGWSAPCAVSLMGCGWGFQIGGEVTDVVLALRSQEQLSALINSEGFEHSPPSFSSSGRVFGSLGGSMGLSLGVGRRADASLVSKGSQSVTKPLLSYSTSKGVYLGCSIEGSVLGIRTQVNQRFYGRAVSAFDLLRPDEGIPPPPAASHLYDALHALAQKCDLIPPPPSYEPHSYPRLQPASTDLETDSSTLVDAEDSMEVRESGESEGTTVTSEITREDEEHEEEPTLAVDEEEEVKEEEEEVVWGFTSAWGCTPTLLSASLPAPQVEPRLTTINSKVEEDEAYQ